MQLLRRMDASRKTGTRVYTIKTLRHSRNAIRQIGQAACQLEADWEKRKPLPFCGQRRLIEDHMQEATWYRQDQDKVIRRLGIDKQGNLITPDP